MGGHAMYIGLGTVLLILLIALVWLFVGRRAY
jgi:hypothetical protein